MKSYKSLLISLFILGLSCTPEDGVDGRDGTNGQDGLDGQDGFSIGLVSTDLGNGCRELNFFRDSNNNGVQDGSESSITSFEVCSGITPNIAMVSQDNTSCPNGGKIFTFFNDLDDDGVLDSNEVVLGTESICNGEDGADGSASGTYSLFIEETSSTDCTNGGFVVSVFGDLNGNGEYDSNSETISNSTVICFPSKDSLEYPDYSTLGHDFLLLGVWRLYSIEGTPVPEENRFNIRFYPDPLNPAKLSNSTTNQTGLLEFPLGSTAIGWRSEGRVYNATGWLHDLSFDHSLIEGVKDNFSYSKKDELRFFGGKEGVTPFIEFNIPKVVTESDKFPLGLPNAIFYKVQ
jgi:hypothetical protein